MRIRLNAAPSGGLVGYFEMPPYSPPPQVVTWGIRTFTMRPAEPAPMDDCAYIYDECFSVAISRIEVVKL